MSNKPFDPQNKIIVITGGASGIGAALCHAFVKADASAIIVADVNLAGAEEVCRKCQEERQRRQQQLGRGGKEALPLKTLAKRVDVSSEGEISSLINETEESIGPIDLFVANAGVVPRKASAETRGLTALDGQFPEEEDWNYVMSINVLQIAHVAKHLIPRFLNREGGGHILVTASAAGLLTQLGSVTYATSKAAAVSMSEWLSITYGSRGVNVSCLCPLLVRTPMTEEEGNVSDGKHVDLLKASLTAAGRDRKSRKDRSLEPHEVAQRCIEDLKLGKFLILSHPETQAYMELKINNRDEWICRMRKMNDKLLTLLKTTKSSTGLSKL